MRQQDVKTFVILPDPAGKCVHLLLVSFRCIVTCLGDPNTFILDHLLTLKPVKFLEGELIHDVSHQDLSETNEGNVFIGTF